MTRSALRPRELHTTDRPSLTAVSVTVWRALETSRPLVERIVDDPYAEVFLPAAVRRTLPALRRAQPLVDLPERNALTGLSTFVLTRHRFLDEHLLDALGDGVEQVVVLGAGYDSRAYRFAGALGTRPVFEVDLPPLSRRKAAMVAARPAVFGRPRVVSVEVDFRTDDLVTRLVESGFVTGRRTFVVWEGVAPYLSASAVSGTLSSLRAVVGPGSTLAMDLWDGGGSGLLAPVRRLGAWTLTLVGEPVTFALPPLAASRLLAEHGFGIADLATASELTRRYATAGRRVADSVYVLAATV